MPKPGLPVGCGLQWPPLHLICVVLFVPRLLSCWRCSGSLWTHAVLTVWGGLMLVVSSGSQRWTSLEKSFPDPTQNNLVGTVCSAVAICWLLSLGAWFLPRLGVSLKASVMPQGGLCCLPEQVLRGSVSRLETCCCSWCVWAMGCLISGWL